MGPGYLLLTTRVGSARTYAAHRGLVILDNRGDIVYYQARHHSVNDLKVITYQGQPMLAWHEYGRAADGGSGGYYVMNQHYQIVRQFTVGAPRFYTDMHELTFTRRGTILLAAHPDWYDRRNKRRVRDFVRRELDPATGAVVTDWDARYHVPRRYSYFGRPKANTLWEPWHGNSMREMRDGGILVSMRNTSALYKLNLKTGAVIWTLGGRHDSFDLTRRHRSWQFCNQHDASELSNGHILVFDDGGSSTACPNHVARAEEFALNTRAHTVRLVRQFSSRDATPDGQGYYAWYVGNARRLSNGDTLVGWGQIPHVSEFTPDGRVNFDLTLATWSYRAVRANWVGLPTTDPAVAARRSGRRVTVWASWNGATQVRAWTLLAGRTPGSLAVVGPRRRRTGFETTITTHDGARYVAVKAVDRYGKAIGRSKTIAVR